MLTYRVCDDEGVIRYQGTDYAKATECLASFWDDCQDYATIETRDVEPCGHYGHSRWIDRKTAYDYYGI